MKKRIGVLASDCLAAVALLAMAAASTELLGQNKTNAKIPSGRVNAKLADATELRIERIDKAIDPVDASTVPPGSVTP